MTSYDIRFGIVQVKVFLDIFSNELFFIYNEHFFVNLNFTVIKRNRYSFSYVSVLHYDSYFFR